MPKASCGCAAKFHAVDPSGEQPTCGVAQPWEPRSLLFESIPSASPSQAFLSQVINSIIGWYSSVGQWSRIENGSVIGEDVHFKDEVYVNGGIVLPHKEIKENITVPQIIM